MKKVITIFLMALAVMTVFVSCDDAPHVHEFSQDWKYDETYHWHPATCGDTEEVDSKGEHVWEYKTSEDGTKHLKTCKTCSYSLEEEHKNEYKLTDDKAKHYQVCTLCSAETGAVEHKFTAAVTEDKTKHQEACVCGYKKEAESHVVEAWTIDKDSTEDEEGEKHGSCTVCGCLVKATIDMKEHTHKESENYGYDENTHWYKCTKAGCSYKFSEKEHSLTYVKDDADGHYQKCACGYTTEKKGHDLKYVVSEDGKYHQQKCDTCNYSTLETAHTYNVSNHDTTNHWNECACGKEDTKSAHTYSSDAIVKDGKAVQVCGTCKYENAVTGATITVKDEKAFAEAVNAAGVSTVKFGNDIEVTSEIAVSQPVTIDMNNFVMTVNDGSITAGKDVIVTIKNIDTSEDGRQEAFDIEGTEAMLYAYGNEETGGDNTNIKFTLSYYPTLKGAVEAASGRDMIIVEKNVTLENEIEVKKTISIVLNDSLNGAEKIKIVSGGSISVYNSKDSQDLGFDGAVAKTTSQGEGASGTYYPSLDNAITAAGDEETVKLLDDVSLGEQSVVIKRSLTLDLNKKKISSTGTAVTVKGNNVKVTITGNGEIEASDRAVEAIEDATVNIKDGKYRGTFAVCAGRIYKENKKITSISDGHVVIESGEFNSTEFTVPVWGTSSAEIKGGTFTATDNAVIGTNGSSELGSDNYTITISGGTFNGGITSSGYIACGIYMANSGTVDVSGGTFNITGGIGILVRSGSLTATGGTITLTTKDGLTEGLVGDSKVVIKTDSQVVVDDKAGYPGTAPEIESNEANFAVKTTEGDNYTTTSD